jgi:hypothetical protein
LVHSDDLKCADILVVFQFFLSRMSCLSFFH